MTERVLLAYSGRLDTSVPIESIAEQTGAEVVFDQLLAKGFVQLWELPSKIAPRRDQRDLS